MGSGPGGRSWAASWTDNQGNLWLFGGGTNDIFQDVNELWEYVPLSNQWTLRGGGGTTNQFGVYGILGTPSTANIPGATTSVYSWTDNNGNVWLYGGVFLQPQCMNSTCDPPDVAVDNVDDLWLFSPSTSEWTWMAGVKMADCAIQCTPPPVYGTLGTPAAQNTPGGRYGGTTWKDRSGRLWLFGGSSAGYYNYLNNDLWVFQPVPDRLLTETPTFNVPAGTYSSTQYVAVSDATPGAKIYFTTDGTTPTSNSTVYSGPVTVNTSLTLQAIANATGYGDSRVASAAYTIDRTLPDFSVGSSPASLSLTNGQSGTVTISVKPQGSFASAVSFTCSGLPAGAACSFSPATVTPSGASASTMLTVTTSRTTGLLRRIDPMLFPESLLAALFCCFGWTKRNSFRSFLVLATSLIGLALLNGCGGQSTHQQQPVMSTITVTAASGSIRHATTISLTLN